MIWNKKRLTLHNSSDEFQNKGPEYAIIQFSKANVFKTSSIWMILFFGFGLFAFFVGRIFGGEVNYKIAQLDITISLWGLLAFLLGLWFLSYTRRFNYALSMLNYLHRLILIFVFVSPYFFYKLSLFGAIDNSKFNPKEAINAIRILFYVWMLLQGLVFSSWYLTTILSRRKYRYAFVKASFLFPILLLFLITPLSLTQFNKSFLLEQEIAFLTTTCTLIFGFAITIAFLSKYQTLGQSNLRIVNRAFGAELSYATFGAVLGSFFYQTYWTATRLVFSSLTIVAIVIALMLLFLFMGLIIYRKHRFQNSFLNKVIVKAFTLTTLIMMITLVYIVNSKIEERVFGRAIPIILPFLGVHTCFFFFASSFLKLVVFERWPAVTKIANFTIAALFIFMQAFIATLADGKILYDWLGSFLIVIIFSIYALIELIAFIPDLVVILMATTNQTQKPSKIIN